MGSNANSQQRLLDINEASVFLGLKVSKIRSLVFNKEIPVIKINRLVRFDVNDLEAWITNLKK